MYISQVVAARRGRCGEYSILMLRILQELGYTARWVVDRDDHVSAFSSECVVFVLTSRYVFIVVLGRSTSY